MYSYWYEDITPSLPNTDTAYSGMVALPRSLPTIRNRQKYTLHADSREESRLQNTEDITA